MNAPPYGMKKVLCPITTNKGKKYWLKIGRAFPNRDGSTNVYLDAYPSNGQLQIRDLDDRDFRRDDGAAAPGRDAPAVDLGARDYAGLGARDFGTPDHGEPGADAGDDITPF